MRENNDLFAQIRFPQEFWDQTEAVSTEIGLPSCDFFCKVVQENKQIKKITYFSYDLHVNSDDELMALDLKELSAAHVTRERLTDLSQKIHRWIGARDSETGRDVEIALGVSSQVTLYEGGTAHLPMLDFMDRNINPKLDLKIVTVLLKPYPGAILETGNSFHFLGRRLLSEDDWRSFMNNSRKALSKYGQDVCEGFFDFSLRRGFSGLRLFAYPRFKKVEPCIVALV